MFFPHKMSSGTSVLFLNTAAIAFWKQTFKMASWRARSNVFRLIRSSGLHRQVCSNDSLFPRCLSNPLLLNHLQINSLGQNMMSTANAANPNFSLPVKGKYLEKNPYTSGYQHRSADPIEQIEIMLQGINWHAKKNSRVLGKYIAHRYIYTT